MEARGKREGNSQKENERGRRGKKKRGKDAYVL